VGWWQAWVLLGLMGVSSAVTVAALYPRHKAILEKRFLRRELDGCGDYMSRVRYWLLPGLW